MCNFVSISELHTRRTNRILRRRKNTLVYFGVAAFAFRTLGVLARWAGSMAVITVLITAEVVVRVTYNRDDSTSQSIVLLSRRKNHNLDLQLIYTHDFTSALSDFRVAAFALRTLGVLARRTRSLTIISPLVPAEVVVRVVYNRIDLILDSKALLL